MAPPGGAIGKGLLGKTDWPNLNKNDRSLDQNGVIIIKL